MRFLNAARQVVTAFVAVVLLLFAIPAVLAWAAVTGRRLRRLAGRTACGRCGTVLGAAAVDRARAGTAARYAEQRRMNPDERLRLAPGPDAVCVACGAEHRRAGGAFGPTAVPNAVTGPS